VDGCGLVDVGGEARRFPINPLLHKSTILESLPRHGHRSIGLPPWRGNGATSPLPGARTNDNRVEQSSTARHLRP